MFSVDIPAKTDVYFNPSSDEITIFTQYNQGLCSKYTLLFDFSLDMEISCS